MRKLTNNRIFSICQRYFKSKETDLHKLEISNTLDEVLIIVRDSENADTKLIFSIIAEDGFIHVEISSYQSNLNHSINFEDKDKTLFFVSDSIAKFDSVIRSKRNLLQFVETKSAKD